MTTELAPKSPSLPEAIISTAERLEQLAKQANEAHLKVPTALRYGLVCAYEAGQALLLAYEICPTRKWSAWLAAKFRASRSTAGRYMDFARECDRLGLNASTLTQIPPNEASSALKKLTVLPSGKRKEKASRTRQPALPSAARDNTPGAPTASASPAGQPEMREPLPAVISASAGASVDPFPRFVQLLEELIAGLEAVMNGEDCHDGPFAELLLMDLRTPYNDLLEYLEDREQLKQSSALART